jgi:hypothetical protein
MNDMNTPPNGNDSTPPELLMYWIRERYRILTEKLAGKPSPWSSDPVFQTTYFCNVRREDDKVTRWIRDFYSPYVDHPLFEYNIVLSRFLNRVESLKGLGFFTEHDPESLLSTLNGWADAGFTIWGGAYVITTHGVKMPKAAYLARNVLGGLHERLDKVRSACRGTHLAPAAEALEGVEGIGSFLSAQIVADLKNTPHHPLMDAFDWGSFVQPGPGSLRGVSWFKHGHPDYDSRTNFVKNFVEVRRYADEHWPEEVPRICNQDLQNCLCEFDKYMRVRNGTGRSKRRYNGT